MSDYTPIDCNHYDYIEVACLYRYRLRVSTSNGQILTGVAIDTQVDGDKKEYLVLKAEDRELLIRLDSVTTIEPLTEDARFGKIRFQAQ